MQELIGTLPFGQHLLAFLPGLRELLLITPLALVYGTLVFTLAGRLKIHRHTRTAFTRKVFHFAIFTMASVVHLIGRLPGVVVFGGVIFLLVLYAVWRGDGHPWYEALARPTDAPHRTLFIVIPLLTTALGGFTSNVLFPDFAYVGYLVCGWGDAVGEPVGSRWGRHFYRVPSLAGVPATRSLEGSGAVFLVGSMAAALGLLAGGYDAGHSLAIGLACGLGSAVVEAISTHGLDNFTTQLMAAALAGVLTR
jgi:phytol kinase